MSALTRLVWVHALMTAGEAAFAVSLADSLFLSITPDAARSRVLLFLAFSVAPFAVLAPLIGPFLDRMPGGRRSTVLGVGVARAALMVTTIRYLDSLALIGLTFGSLVLARTYAVSRAAIVPTLVVGDDGLMSANGRLGRVAGVAGTLGALVAAPLQWIDPTLSLSFAAALFLLAGLRALSLPRHRHVPSARPRGDVRESAAVRSAGRVMLVMRGLVGFLFFHVAFWLRGEKAGTAWFALALATASLAIFLSNIVGPVLRRRVREGILLDASLVVVAVVGSVSAYVGGITAGIVLVGIVNGMAGVARLAFESIVQSRTPDEERARVFVAHETRNQIAWVVAGLVAVALTPTGAVGFLLVGVAAGVAAAYAIYSS